MATNRIRLTVVDQGGKPLPGQLVEQYFGPSVRTDENGIATLEIKGIRTTIRINGFEAYDGPVEYLIGKTFPYDEHGRRMYAE